MKRILRIFAWTTLAAIAVAIIVRAAVVANRVEGGWQILSEHLTAGLPLVIDQSNLSENPVIKWQWEQAERTAHDSQATANDLLCAAQLLTARDWIFPLNAPQALGRIIWGKSGGSLVDFPGSSERRNESIELASRAIDLAPMDEDVCRARMLLMIDGGTMTSENDDEWPENTSIVRAAMAVEPTNAFYDYVQGNRCNLHSQTWVERQGEDEYGSDLIINPTLLQDCQDHYSLGFSKPRFAVSSNCFASMADYLKRAPGSVAMKVNSIDPWVLYALPINAIDWLRMPFDDQSLDAENLAEIDGMNLWFVYQNFGARWKSQCSAAERLVGESVYELARSQQRTKDEERVLAAIYAWNRAYQDERGQHARWSAYPSLAIAASVLGWALTSAAILTTLGGWGLRRILRSTGESPRPVWCYLNLSLSFVGTLAVLGVFCAYSDRISMENPWFLIWATIGVVVCSVAAVFWSGIRFVLRQGKRRREERSILFNGVRLTLAVTGSFLILIPLLCVSDPKIRRNLAMTWSEMPRVVHLNWRVHVPAPPANRLSDVLLQWGGHYGLVATIGLWVILLMFFRRRSSLGMSDSPAARLLSRFTGALHGIARSGLPLAAILFLISIAAITQWMVHLQTQYERQLVRLANPRWVDAEIEAYFKPLELPLTESAAEGSD
jgi:hypothetical protein